MEKPIFEVKNLEKTEGEQHILKHISLSLYPGEILGIYGTNASSKSTLLRALSGLTRIDSAFFQLDGQPCKISTPVQASRLGIYALLNDQQLLKNLSISDNLFLGAYTKNKLCNTFVQNLLGCYSLKNVRKAAEQLLAKYSLDINPDADIKSLNSCQLQMLLILRSIVNSARVLLIDDCLSSMDDKEAHSFGQFLKHIATDGISIILASQNYFRLKDIADRVQIIREGALYQNTANDSILSKFQAGSPFSYPKLPADIGPELYRCTNLCYRNILHNVSLSLRRGEIIGVLGASGSGRTTLANTICGYYTPTSGQTLLRGINLKITSTVKAKKYGISLISGSTICQGLIPHMTIQDNITISNLHRIQNKKIPFFINRRRDFYYCANMINKLGLQIRQLKDQACYLSNGSQKKVCFGKSVFSGAELFVLDEPTKEIDYPGKIQIYNIITELAQEQNGILLFTSDIEEAMGMCDRIFIMQSGTITCEVLPAKTTPAKLHQLIFASTASNMQHL